MKPETLTEIVFRSFQRFNRPDHFGVKRDGRWQMLSTLEIRERVRQLAGSLVRAGIGPGDRVAIVSPTRFEWALADYAVLSVRGVVVPVYPTLSAPAMAYILKHSGARLAFAGGPEEHAKIASVRGDLPDLKEVVAFDPVADAGVRSLEPFMELSGPSPAEGPFPEDLASIIYTSGTTGDPKGVMLTHANIVANVLACSQAFPFRPSDSQLSFLPLSHVYERMVHYYMLWNGLTVYFAESIAKLKENLLEVRPTVLVAMPRVLEKVMASVEEKARAAEDTRGKLARFALDAARGWAREAWGPQHDASIVATVKRFAADQLVLHRIREAMGGRLRVVITGGASTPDAVTEFFLGAGITVLPGYGLTEASPVIAFNTPQHFRFGTVGKPVPGVEVKIATDGEILARGASMMRGYYRNEEATRQAFEDGEWLKTGDIGHLDRDGFLSVTDRKKDLIATSGGKKIAPQPIEQRLCQDPFISQVVLVGEGKPYVAALVVPRFEALESWARERGLPAGDRDALMKHPTVLALYRERIDGSCGVLSSFETVKRFALVEREFTEGAGEMTPTLKIKRRVVMESRRTLVESLFE